MIKLYILSLLKQGFFLVGYDGISGMKPVNFLFGVMHVRYCFCFFCILIYALDNYYK